MDWLNACTVFARSCTFHKLVKTCTCTSVRAISTVSTFSQPLKWQHMLKSLISNEIEIHFNKKSLISMNNLGCCIWLLPNPSVQPGTSHLCSPRICLLCLHALSSCRSLLLITGNLRTASRSIYPHVDTGWKDRAAVNGCGIHSIFIWVPLFPYFTM